MGPERLYSDVLGLNGTRIGADDITVIKLDRSGGSVDRDEDFLRRFRQAQVREYFYGDSKVSLSPHVMHIKYDEMSVYRVPEG